MIRGRGAGVGGQHGSNAPDSLGLVPLGARGLRQAQPTPGCDKLSQHPAATSSANERGGRGRCLSLSKAASGCDKLSQRTRRARTLPELVEGSVRLPVQRVVYLAVSRKAATLRGTCGMVARFATTQEACYNRARRLLRAVVSPQPTLWHTVRGLTRRSPATRNGFL